MDVTWGIGLAVIGAGLYGLWSHWRRRRQAAKLADKLLAEVLKTKDSFRR